MCWAAAAPVCRGSGRRPASGGQRGPSRGSEGGARGGGRGPLQLLQRGSWDPAERERRGRALRPKAFQHILWEVP